MHKSCWHFLQERVLTAHFSQSTAAIPVCAAAVSCRITAVVSRQSPSCSLPRFLSQHSSQSDPAKMLSEIMSLPLRTLHWCPTSYRGTAKVLQRSGRPARALPPCPLLTPSAPAALASGLLLGSLGARLFQGLCTSGSLFLEPLSPDSGMVCSFRSSLKCHLHGDTSPGLLFMVTLPNNPSVPGSLFLQSTLSFRTDSLTGLAVDRVPP